MDYGIIIAVAAYIAGIQSVIKFGLSPVFGAIIAVGVPFVVGKVVYWILIGSNLTSLWGDVFNLANIFVLLVQFFIMILLLRYLKNTDSLATYFALSLVGYVGIIIVLPLIINKLLELTPII